MCKRLKFADSLGDGVVVLEVVLDDHTKQRATAVFPEEFGSEDSVFGLLGAVASEDEVALRSAVLYSGLLGSVLCLGIRYDRILLASGDEM